jgi:DNA-binding transcriptional LysR family regulator
VKVHVEYRRANQVYEDVLGNVVDLGIVAYPARNPKLEIVQLRKDALVLICHPQHPFAKLKSIPLKMLDGQKFIGYEKDIPTQKALDKIFRAQGVTLQSVMEFDNVETIKRAVEIDSGVAIVPATTVEQEAKSRSLVAVRLDSPACVRPLGLIHKKSKVLSPAMQRLIELLKKPV